MKICSSCKLSKPFEDFNKTKSNKDGLSYLCKNCNLISTRLYRLRNKREYYSNQQKYRATLGGFISQTLHNCKTRANKKNFEFDLTLEDLEKLIIEQNMKCAITGLTMNFESQNRKRANPFKCSVDRINSEKGYTTDNIQLVCWAVNQIKSDKTDEEFKFWIINIHKAISSQAPKGEGSTTISKESTLK